MPRHPRTLELNFSKGIDNISEELEKQQGYASELENVDVDNLGTLRRREGLTKILDGNFKTAIVYGKVFIAQMDDSLVVIDDSLTVTSTLVSGILGTVSFKIVEDKLYAISLNKNLLILPDLTVKPFGLQPPNPAPLLQLGPGGLPEGDYFVYLTYVSAEGVESGSLLGSHILLPNTAGIELVNLPVSPEASKYRVYVTEPNSINAFLVGEYPVGVPSITITSTNSTIPFNRFNIHPAPYGDILEFHKGRFYIASENILYYSEYAEFFDWKLAESYFVFEDDIRAVMPVDSGIWIAADALYFLSGDEPSRMDLRKTDSIKIIPGSESKIKGEDLVIDQTPLGDKWLIASDHGIYLLFNQGVSFSLANNYSVPVIDSCNSGVMYKDGLTKYILSAKKRRENNFQFQDSFEPKVIRA